MCNLSALRRQRAQGLQPGCWFSERPYYKGIKQRLIDPVLLWPATDIHRAAWVHMLIYMHNTRTHTHSQSRGEGEGENVYSIPKQQFYRLKYKFQFYKLLFKRGGEDLSICIFCPEIVKVFKMD